MKRYDPDKEPDAAKWLALSEAERIELATDVHRADRLDADALVLHSALHVAVETQLATREPASVPHALARLRAQGLSRHDAVHAIASVLAEQLQAAVGGGATSATSLPKAYDDAISVLDGNKWLAVHRGDG
jgi:Domain of unknown function (DUF1841)